VYLHRVHFFITLTFHRSLFVDLLEDSLSEATYDARLAGLSVSCSFNFEGFDIYVSGYNEKLPVLLDTVIHEVRNLVISQDRLDVYIEEVSVQPFLQAEYFVEQSTDEAQIRKLLDAETHRT
jgi:secreted Zn-dependent insulinase-like peptidase